MATYTKEKDIETTLEDDSEARKAMQEVFLNTARWPEDFGGFSANVVANINGEEQQGTVTVKNAKEIEMSVDKHIFLAGKKTNILGLEQSLNKLDTKTKKQTAIIRADKVLPYGEVIEVMGLLQKAGVPDISVAVK